MCGRYDLSDNPAAIRAKFMVPVVPAFSPNPDFRPTNTAPVVRRSHASREREVAMLRWGLVPVWAKELKFGARCINARAETLASTPSFRVAYRKRRCLVPVNAFFEWTGEPGHKVKWRIGLKDEPLFALAGLWEWWKDPASQQGVETYTIVTTRANDLLEPFPDEALQVAKA
jgi:putative SOS response-associated peptidase YedK